MKKIKCNSINYRKGFVEITEDIHVDCINLEVWRIHPDSDISQVVDNFDDLSDEDFTGNVELELSVDAAQSLVDSLEKAIVKLKAKRK